MTRRRQRLCSLGKRILSENRTGRGTIGADSTTNFRTDTIRSESKRRSAFFISINGSCLIEADISHSRNYRKTLSLSSFLYACVCVTRERNSALVFYHQTIECRVIYVKRSTWFPRKFRLIYRNRVTMFDRVINKSTAE